MFNLIISIMKSTRNLKPLWLLMFFCLIPFWATAQTVTISGNVKDSAGVPVIGASVLEKGTTNGIITDFDGNFTLSVENNSTLVISIGRSCGCWLWSSKEETCNRCYSAS